MPFNYFITTLAFVLAFFAMILLTVYKFDQLELKKKRLELSRDIFEHMLSHEDDDGDDGDDGPDLSEIFSRPSPDSSIISNR